MRSGIRRGRERFRVSMRDSVKGQEFGGTLKLQRFCDIAGVRTVSTVRGARML